MGLSLVYSPYILKFKDPAGTSRGRLFEKESWYIKVFEESDRTIAGLGEVSTLPRLSVDFDIDMAVELQRLQKKLMRVNLPDTIEEIYNLVSSLVPVSLPSIRFALETAFLDLHNGGHREIFKNPFYLAGKRIPINGLIWMGDYEYMRSQVDDKLDQNFNCIKIKVGAIDFDQECKLIEYIRSKRSSQEVTIRLDANGGFLTNEVLIKLKKLAQYEIHSIEQPIMPRQWEAMSLICEKSIIPIALDEELIGGFDALNKQKMLEEIRPDYIVLKPSLLGGFQQTTEWITTAESMGIGWWITSALESNIGLNAISQYSMEMGVDMPQGLGTGQLYHNNIPSPLRIDDQSIQYDPESKWETSLLNV